MKIARAWIVLSCIGLVVGSAYGDDLLGKKKGNSGSGGSVGNGGGTNTGANNAGGGKGGSAQPPPKVDGGLSKGNSGGAGGNSAPPVRIGGSQASSRTNDPVLTREGRIDAGRDDLLNRRREQSRSGRVEYGTVHNVGAVGRIEAPPTIGRAPIDVRTGTLQNQVLREERVTLTHGGLRVGYYHYNRGWRDDFFCYPYYQFSPAGRFVVSPWYYYPQLPPYLVVNRIFHVQSLPPTFVGMPYRWNRPTWGFGGSTHSALDYALDDLVTAFERGDVRLVSRMIPRRGGVNVYMDGSYAYSVQADDFYDMIADNIQSTRTSRYTILDVRTDRDRATIRARHDYQDPWGRRMSVFHTFHLERERNDLVIREFGVSESRVW
jgi:hypothetical protein